MIVKVFQTNEKGKIEFTRCELEKLLNEVYQNGYTDGENDMRKQSYVWTSPYITTTTATLLDNSLSNIATNSDTAPIDNFTYEIKNPNNVIVDCTSANNESTEPKEVKEKQKTSSSASKTFENKFDNLMKVIDELLGSEFDAKASYGRPNLNSSNRASVSNDPFTSLAKELNDL